MRICLEERAGVAIVFLFQKKTRYEIIFLISRLLSKIKIHFFYYYCYSLDFIF